MSLQVIRIEAKLKEIFSNKIDMKDETSGDANKFNMKYLSRCLAAYAIVMKTGVEPEIASNAVTDGFNDFGIDAVYRDESSKKLYLVQAKWSNDGNGSISQGDTAKFIQGVERLLNLDFKDCNKKIESKISDIEHSIKEMDYQIELIVIYTSNQSLPVDSQRTVDNFKNRINDDTNELILSNAILINQIYDCMSNSNNSVQIDLDDVLLNDWGVFEENGDIKGFYGTISAAAVAEWWKIYGVSLLSKNIRYFKGDTEVNQGIKKVLKENPDKFCYYNNGIKIIADKVTRKLLHATDRKSGLLKVENANIVNGAQTAGSIGEAFKNFPEEVGKASVMVQIISLENMEENFGDDVTRLSNTQNRIENKDFVSMDPIQEKIRKDMMLDSIEYIYKAGTSSSNFDKNCILDEVSVSVGCSLEDVTIAATIKRAYGSIFDNLSKPPYKSIFNPSLTSYKIWNSVIVFRKFEYLNNIYQDNNQNLNKLISVHGNRFILHMILIKLKEEGILYNDKYIENFDELEPKIESLISQNVVAIIEIKNRVFPDAYPANIFKNGGRCKTIKEELLKN